MCTLFFLIIAYNLMSTLSNVNTSRYIAKISLQKVYNCAC